MSRKSTARSTLVAYLFLTPAILGLVFMTFLPILGVIGMSLTRWTGLQPPVWVGLGNFKHIFTEDMFFGASVKATLYFAFGSVILGTVYAFAIAMLLNQRIRARGFFRSVFFLPYIVPSIGAAVVWGWMYESNFGVFNYFLNLLGLDKVRWLAEDATATPALIIMTIWGLGNFIVIYLAGLQGVPKTYLEAVEIDGGNAWHKFRHITLPLMSPIIFFNVLMSIITNLQVFVPAYSITKGAPDNTTLYMVYLIYRESFQRNNFGLAAAYSLIFFVFVALITALIFRTSRSWTFFEGE
ncbi:MAG TPA: sugar ABC transporter permease [Rectinemataceae bacterium]|nr:sugar ABC transporter permease [Rectinemataceae bacterium]